MPAAGETVCLSRRLLSGKTVDIFLRLCYNEPGKTMAPAGAGQERA